MFSAYYFNWLLLCVSLVNIIIGILYGLGDGPYVQLERIVVPARQLKSSGSDAGIYICFSLISFAICLSFCVISNIQPYSQSTRIGIFFANHIFYFFLFVLGAMDISIEESIANGDFFLPWVYIVPNIFLAIVVVLYCLRYFVCLVVKPNQAIKSTPTT